MRAAKLDRQRQDGEELAHFNPEWAVLSEPEARFFGWDMDAFFRRGADQIERTMCVASELDLPRGSESVLKISDRDLIRAYIAEFARVLVPGGLLAFQLPSEMPLIYRVMSRKRLYRVARALGWASRALTAWDSTT